MVSIFLIHRHPGRSESVPRDWLSLYNNSCRASRFFSCNGMVNGAAVTPGTNNGEIWRLSFPLFSGGISLAPKHGRKKLFIQSPAVSWYNNKCPAPGRKPIQYPPSCAPGGAPAQSPHRKYVRSASLLPGIPWLYRKQELSGGPSNDQEISTFIATQHNSKKAVTEAIVAMRSSFLFMSDMMFQDLLPENCIGSDHEKNFHPS